MGQDGEGIFGQRSPLEKFIGDGTIHPFVSNPLRAKLKKLPFSGADFIPGISF
jgi:hypothetical protein